MPNPVAAVVVVTAPWGEPQFGAPDCVLAASVSEIGEISHDRYIIGRNEFDDTYEFDGPLNEAGRT